MSAGDRLRCPDTFPAPSGRPDLLILAGEHSGDQHAAKLVEDLRRQHPDLRLAGWGGPAMRGAGVEIIYDLTQASVVGLVEVFRNLGYFRQLFQKTVDWIQEHQPKAIILVDYPGFNLRLAAELKKRKLSRMGGGEIPLLYYIAPQVWAWKKKRRFRMAETIDALGVIFPFEVEVFADTSLPTTFVGHPFLDGFRHEAPVYDPAGPVLLLPGSRHQAVSRILPVLLAGYRAYRKKAGDPVPATIIFPDEAIRGLAVEILARPAYASLKDHVSLGSKDDQVAGRAVLTSSGTMSLHCALAGLPGAIVYRAHPLTFWIGKQVISVPYLGINNILLNRPMYPEYLQGAADPLTLAARLEEMIGNPEVRQATETDARELREHLQTSDNQRAAVWVEYTLRQLNGLFP